MKLFMSNYDVVLMLPDPHSKIPVEDMKLFMSNYVVVFVFNY